MSMICTVCVGAGGIRAWNPQEHDLRSLGEKVNPTDGRSSRDECTQQARAITSRVARDTTSREWAQPKSAKARRGHWQDDDRLSPEGNRRMKRFG